MRPREPFVKLVARLHRQGVRFLLCGVAGANYYAAPGAALFATQDRDLFMPPETENTLLAWRACESTKLLLRCGAEPLDVPRDRDLAARVVERRALVRATDARGLDVDLTLVMTGFDFEAAWSRRRLFMVEDVTIPVARLADILESKAHTGRDKDKLFLATHAETLAALLEREG